MKCAICDREFSAGDRIVRLIAEVARKGEDDDGDPEYFSEILDWDSIVMMHLECVQGSINEGYDWPHEDELGDLVLFGHDDGDLDQEFPGKPRQMARLRLIDGGR